MKKNFERAILPLFIALAFSSCSPAYCPADGNGFGYSDSQVTNRIFKVSYQGGLATDRNRVECFALYRAAELMKNRGVERFRLLRSSTTSRRLVSETPVVVAMPDRVGGIRAEMTPHIRDHQEGYLTELTFEALDTLDQKSGSEVYVSAEVMRFLGDQIGADRPKTKKSGKSQQN